MSKKALITGITGQDGSYLAELLLASVTLFWGATFPLVKAAVAENRLAKP
jgi:GDP-D-mannose dehydratase